MSDNKYENSSRYFENRDCNSYPCHKGDGHINCLFCYCPLYHMENCPGSFKYVERDGKTIKSCIDCSFPHEADNYDKVIAVIRKQLDHACQKKDIK